MAETGLPQKFVDPRLSANITSPEYRSSPVYELFDRSRGPVAEAYMEHGELWVEIWYDEATHEGLACRLHDLQAFLNAAEEELTKEREQQVWDLSDPKFGLT
jgi:hypothetical protein